MTERLGGVRMNINKEAQEADIAAVVAEPGPVKERPVNGAPHLRIAKRGGVVILTRVEMLGRLPPAGDGEGQSS